MAREEAAVKRLKVAALALAWTPEGPLGEGPRRELENAAAAYADAVRATNATRQEASTMADARQGAPPARLPSDEEILEVARSFGEAGVDLDDLHAALLRRFGAAPSWHELERLLEFYGWTVREVGR